MRLIINIQKILTDTPVVALSPDGTHLVYVANEQLYLRPMESWEGSPISGTEGSWWPFFSPDGQWVGFFADGKLKKVSVNGGAPLILCDAPSARGASWGTNDTIVLGTISAGLLQVPAAGGIPNVLTTLDSEAGERNHRYPQALPDGRTVLFNQFGGTDHPNRI